MASTRKAKEKDPADQTPDRIDLHGMTREEVPCREGLLKQITGKLPGRIMNAETDEHSGYEKNSNAGDNSGDSRNGYSEKTVLTGNRSAVIQVPRDRNATFEPGILPKHQRRLPVFSGRVISMYSFGMAGRDIKPHPEKIYNAEVPPELISRVTEAVAEEVKERRNRQPEKSRAIAYLDALGGKDQAGREKPRQERLCGIRSGF